MSAARMTLIDYSGKKMWHGPQWSIDRIMHSASLILRPALGYHDGGWSRSRLRSWLGMKMMTGGDGGVYSLGLYPHAIFRVVVGLLETNVSVAPNSIAINLSRGVTQQYFSKGPLQRRDQPYFSHFFFRMIKSRKNAGRTLFPV